MTDTDDDGKVTLEDYELLVLKSLKQQGISLEWYTNSNKFIKHFRDIVF